MTKTVEQWSSWKYSKVKTKKRRPIARLKLDTRTRSIPQDPENGKSMTRCTWYSTLFFHLQPLLAEPMPLYFQLMPNTLLCVCVFTGRFDCEILNASHIQNQEALDIAKYWKICITNIDRYRSIYMYSAASEEIQVNCYYCEHLTGREVEFKRTQVFSSRIYEYFHFKKWGWNVLLAPEAQFLSV